MSTFVSLTTWVDIGQVMSHVLSHKNTFVGSSRWVGKYFNLSQNMGDK